jgi:hypothetical protein
MLQNKLLRVVQAHLLGFSTGIMFSGNAFARSACFIRLFSSSVAWSNWSIPNFPTESFIAPSADLSALGGCSTILLKK